LPTVAVFLTTEPGLTGPQGPFASTLMADVGSELTPEEVMSAADRLIAGRFRISTED
jgi:heptosyltransferase-1